MQLQRGRYKISTKNGIDSDLKSSKDKALVEIAREQKRIILTADKDFGELLEFSTKGMGFGVILLRHMIYDVGMIEKDILKALELLEKRSLLDKEFTAVLSEGRIRIRQL